MTVTKETLDDIREELKRSGTEDRELTSKEIVYEIAPVIHERMLAGAKLMSLYAIVKARLPADARLSEATFKKYWRDAREELGLAPIKASGRKGPRQPAADDPQKTLEAVLKNTANATSSYGTTDANDLFPDDPDDPQTNTSSN